MKMLILAYPTWSTTECECYIHSGKYVSITCYHDNARLTKLIPRRPLRFNVYVKQCNSRLLGLL